MRWKTPPRVEDDPPFIRNIFDHSPPAARIDRLSHLAYPSLHFTIHDDAGRCDTQRHPFHNHEARRRIPCSPDCWSLL